LRRAFPGLVFSARVWLRYQGGGEYRSAVQTMDSDQPRVQVAAHLTFGVDGNAGPCKGDGWSGAEAHATWSMGAGSVLRVPYAAGHGVLTLEISGTPMVMPPIIRRQRLTVTANGKEIGSEAVAGETTLSFPVPHADPGRDGELLIGLQHPDAIAPKELGLNLDDRVLGFSVTDILLLWVPEDPPFEPKLRPPLPGRTPQALAELTRGATALSPADLMLCFESLGHNCEFGFVQRNLGAEPLGLLRFGGIQPHSLLRGLDTAFEGIDNPLRLRVYTERDRTREEFLVRDDRYGVQFHTQMYDDETTSAEVHGKMTTHLGFMQRRFQERLETGQAIYVLHHPGCETVPQVLPFLNVLRSYGPHALLYVTADRRVPPGSVEQVKPDLFHGWVDMLPPMNEPHTIRVGAWLSICANTYRLWREAGGNTDVT
jgi:hypothetical protein